MIAGVATGATQGYIYVRAEYPLAVNRLQTAIEQATEVRSAGRRHHGHGFCFRYPHQPGRRRLRLRRGQRSDRLHRGQARHAPRQAAPHGGAGSVGQAHGAEQRGDLRQRAPHHPKGADWYKAIGTEGSPGTKAFALTGNVDNTGLVEVPMGTTLREVIFGHRRRHPRRQEVQGGADRRPLRRLPHRGAPGRSHGLRHPESIGAMMGSGGLVVMDEDTCMVEVARFFMNFTQNESPAASASPCREGTKRMLEIAGAHHRQRGHHGGSGPAGGAVRHHHRHSPVRPGPDGLQARA